MMLRPFGKRAPSTENVFTVGLTFATPGNLSIAYSEQSGWYRKDGRLVVGGLSIITSAFTHTTASGEARITGLPFTVNSASRAAGGLNWQGITKANYTQVNLAPALGQAYLRLQACGSGQTLATLAAADMPTGGSVVLIGNFAFYV